jgi:hypothetical protein
MKVLMLDTKQEVDLDEIEAVRRIQAGVAVEPPVMTQQMINEICRVFEVPPALLGIPEATVTHHHIPETAALDRAGQTMKKPVPQPRPTPQREKRKRK